MRVLLVSHHRSEREAHARVLSSAGHEPEQAGGAIDAITRLQATAFTAVPLDWSLPGGETRTILQRIKAGGAGRPQVIVTLSRDIKSELQSLHELGVHDFLRIPCWNDDLLTRVRMAERREIAARNAEDFDWSGEEEVEPLPAWSNVGELVGRDVAMMTGCRVDVVDRPANKRHIDVVAMLPLTLTSKAARVDVYVGATRPSLARIARSVLGDAVLTDALLEDVLREIANTAGGAMKRATSADELVSSALPVMSSSKAVDEVYSRAPWRFDCVSSDGTALVFVVDKLAITPIRVPARKLVEGMVLTSDLTSASGLLLVARGTRLTDSTAHRVAQLLGSEHPIEVAAA